MSACPLIPRSNTWNNTLSYLANESRSNRSGIHNLSTSSSSESPLWWANTVHIVSYSTQRCFVIMIVLICYCGSKVSCWSINSTLHNKKVIHMRVFRHTWQGPFCRQKFAPPTPALELPAKPCLGIFTLWPASPSKFDLGPERIWKIPKKPPVV